MLDRMIAEDVPYFDLTTYLLGIGDKMEPSAISPATKAKRMVDIVRAVNPHVAVTARKNFPGTKGAAPQGRLMWRGAAPQAESVLIFKQHTNFMGGPETRLS